MQQQKQTELQTKKKLATDLESYYLSLPNADINHLYLVAKGISNHEAIKQYHQMALNNSIKVLMLKIAF